MRLSVGFMLILSALFFVAPAHAQPKKEKGPIKASSRTILANLDSPVKASLSADPIKFSTFLAIISHELHQQGRDVAFSVDEGAFREENPDLDVSEAEVRLRNLPANATIQYLLRQALKQLPMKSAFVIRAGHVEIVPAWRTSKEYMLNQTFYAAFNERPLDQALDNLSELTGVSIVLDPRIKQKAQTVVSARFHDDVALQDAVRILTDMAELKIVYLVTGLYVTTPEHAKQMQKELKEIYEHPEPTNVPFMPGIGGPPMESPLAPPLPPAKNRRVDGAA